MIRGHTSGWLRLSARRALSQRWLLAAVGGLTIVVTFLLTGVSGFLSLSATRDALDTLAAASASQQRFELQTRRSDDAATQLDAAAEVLAQELAGARLGGSPVTVTAGEREEDGTAYVTWTITPDAATLTAADIPSLVTGLDALQRRFTDDDRIVVSGVTTDGSLATTLAGIQRHVEAEQGARVVPVLLIALTGAVAVAQTARVVAAARSPELALIRARGASARRLWLSAAAEGAVVAVPAAMLGGAAAALALTATIGIAPGPSFWFLVVGIGCGVAVVLAAATAAALRSSELATPVYASRQRTAVGIGSLVIVALLTVVSVAQFRLAGGPLVQGSTGVPVVDPLLAAAPALLVLFTTLAGLAAFGPVARLAERVAARSRGASPALPLRQIARRVGLHTVTATVVSMTVGTVLLAGSYSATLAGLAGLPQEARVGTDVRVSWQSGVPSDGGSALLSVPGVTAAAPVLVTAAQIGSERVEVVAAASGALPSVMTTLRGAVDLEAVAGMLDGTGSVAGPPGLPLDTGALPFTVTIALPDTAEPPPIRVRLLALDVDGSTLSLPLDTADVGRGGSTAITATVPEGDWRLLGVDLAFSAGIIPGAETLEVSEPVAVTVHLPGALAIDDAWGVEDFDSLSVGAGSADDATLVTFPLGPTASRFVLTAPGVEPRSPVPAVVGEQLADRLALVDGDSLTLRSAALGETFDVVVAGTVASVPGTTSPLGLIVDLRAAAVRAIGSLGEASLANQSWVATPEPRATADTLESVAAGARITTRLAEPAPATTAIALWMGAVGAIALTGATMLAGAVMTARARHGELRIVRALGMTARQIAADRRLELGTVAVFGTLLGAASGVIASVVTVGDLARSATIGVPGGLTVELHVDIPTIAGCLAALAVVVWAVAVASGLQATSRRATSRALGGDHS